MKKALVIYANGSEDLEVTAIADVLARGQVEVTKAALTASGVEVKLSHGTTVLCDKNLHDCKDCYDVIAIPGGLPGATNCRDSEKLIAMLTEQKAHKRLIAAICAAPGFVLAHHGLISTERATGYPGCDSAIKNCTHKGVEVSEDGLIITGKGPAYAVSFALEILKALQGEECMRQVASGMLVEL
jgi:DJ-1 family protein